jgi:hypothetical protein
MGKTELALHAARSLLPNFDAGVWFVSLVGVEPPLSLSEEASALQVDRLHQILATELATVLGLTLEGNGSPQEQVKAYLRDKALQ